MPAYSDVFPWRSHYGEYDFFEARMKGHGRVKSIEALDAGLYQITKKDGAVLRAFICECYSYGIAEYMETTQKLGKLDAVVINSDWCGYTDEAKIECRNGGVGLFKIGEFMGALNRPDFWMYLTDWQEERYKKRGLV